MTTEGEPSRDCPWSVPTTISPEARAALAKFPFQVGFALPDDAEGWRALQAAMEAKFAAPCSAAVDRYEPKIERRALGGVPVVDIKPKGWDGSGRVLVYVHGGGYVTLSAASTLFWSVPVAADTGTRVVSVDYTLAPHARWDEATDQVVAVMAALGLDGHAMADIAVYGDSAGGAMAAGAILKMRDRGVGMPAALVLMSPYSDISNTGDTYATLRDRDPILGVVSPESQAKAAAAYADPVDHKNPYVSPVYGDYGGGFLPTLIQAGTKEVYLSNAVRLYQVLDAAGVEVKLDIYEGMWHGFQGLNWELPEAGLARRKMAKFLERHMGK